MIIYNLHNATYKQKMAGFDYDWTLVKPKGERTFPKDINEINSKKVITDFLINNDVHLLVYNFFVTYCENDVQNILFQLSVSFFQDL